MRATSTAVPEDVEPNLNINSLSARNFVRPPLTTCVELFT